MSVLSHVHALCETIRHRVTIPVLLGRPDWRFLACMSGRGVWRSAPNGQMIALDHRWVREDRWSTSRHAAPIFSSFQCLHCPLKVGRVWRRRSSHSMITPCSRLMETSCASSLRRASRSKNWPRCSSRRRCRCPSARRVSLGTTAADGLALTQP